MHYARLLQRCINTPLMIEESKLQVLTSEVFLKLLANEPIDRSQPTPAVPDTIQYDTLCIIPVYGSLVNKNGVGSSGITSYEYIQAQILNLIDNGITTIGFDISSGGGEAQGSFPLTDLIYSLPSKFNVDTFAFSDSSACSAAYSIMAACKKVYATDMASVGSIGTIITLMDTTKADSQDGIKYEILRSKSDKAPYQPMEGITDKARQHAEDMLKAWDTKFNNTIVTYRPQVSLENINKLNGASILAKDSLQYGLVDQIVHNLDEVLTLYQNPSTNNSSSTNTGTAMATQEETLTKLVEAQTQLASLKASAELDIKSAIKLEQARCLAILEAKETFNVSNTTAINAIKQGFSLDMVTAMFTEIKANMDASTVIVTNTANMSSASPGMVANLQALVKEQAEPKNLGGGLFSMADLLNGMSDVAQGVE